MTHKILITEFMDALRHFALNNLFSFSGALVKNRPNILFIMADQLAASAALAMWWAARWFGFVAPAGTKAAILRRFNEQVNKALKAPEVIDRLQNAYAFAEGGTPEEFTKFLGAEGARWTKLVKDANLKPD